MAKPNKTQATPASFDSFVGSMEDAQQREDTLWLADAMRAATGHPPVLWGGAIVGFGTRRLRYDSGRELDWFSIGFSPRKGKLVLYLCADAAELAPHLARLGRHTTGKACIYLRRLADADKDVLREMIGQAARINAA